MHPLRIPLLVAAATAATVAEGCLRLNVNWETRKHIRGELWDEGKRVCSIDTDTKLPEHSNLWGFPFECVYGYRATIGATMRQVNYYPRRRWGQGSLLFDTTWNITHGVHENLPDWITVWASLYNCTTCIGPLCALDAA